MVINDHLECLQYAILRRDRFGGFYFSENEDFPIRQLNIIGLGLWNELGKECPINDIPVSVTVNEAIDITAKNMREIPSQGWFEGLISK